MSDIGSIEKRLERVEISRIQVNDKNWRKHGRDQRRLFRSSIEEIGYLTPIIWNEKTGNLIDGELRFTEMKAMGEKEIEAIVVNVDAEEELKILALLDKISDMADGDKQRYQELVLNMDFKVEHLEIELKKMEDKLQDIERAEYELVPEMLVEYDYIILVFKDKVNFSYAKEKFGVDYKIDRYCDSKGESRVVDGDIFMAKNDGKI